MPDGARLKIIESSVIAVNTDRLDSSPYSTSVGHVKTREKSGADAVIKPALTIEVPSTTPQS